MRVFLPMQQIGLYRAESPDSLIQRIYDPLSVEDEVCFGSGCLQLWAARDIQNAARRPPRTTSPPTVARGAQNRSHTASRSALRRRDRLRPRDGQQIALNSLPAAGSLR